MRFKPAGLLAANVVALSSAIHGQNATQGKMAEVKEGVAANQEALKTCIPAAYPDLPQR
jgi:hypothetical protein